MERSEVLAERTLQCVKQALSRLQDFWDEVGIPEEHRIERADIIRVQMKLLLDGMISEEEGFKKRLLSDIETFHKQVDTLCQELNLPLFKKEAGKTMLQLEKDLRTRRDVLSKQKNERLSELKNLQTRDQELCRILCEPLYSIDYSVVPSLDNLDHFRRHLIALAGVKYRRKVEFVNAQAQIRLCMEELDRVPVTSFEREVLDEHIEFFCLSAKNIADLRLLLVQLEEQKAQNEAVCVQLRSRITELWNRLQVPAEKRDAFCIDVAGSKSKTRIKLEAELERLETLKHEYLQYVTQGIRKEMLSYWDMCLFSNLQRQAFSPFYDENFTENLLSLHNDEIMRLKHHYEVHKELFEGVKKWKKSWKCFLDCERKASNPYRFAYQDCNLVKEEQEHAELQKTLSQLEEELKVRIGAWEQEQRQEFLVNGQKFMDYMSAQWKMLNDKKEKEKLERDT